MTSDLHPPVNGFPVWVKVIAQVGFPIVVALLLMGYVAPKVGDTLGAVQRHETETGVQTTLLRAICRNTAKTEYQATFCDFGRPSP